MKRPWILAVCQFLLSAGNGLAFPFLAIYLGERRGVSPQSVGAVLSLFVLATAVGEAIGGWAADRWGRKRVMVGALLGRAGLVAALSAVVAQGPLYSLVAVHFLYSLLGSFFQPASHAWVADRYAPRERLAAFSFLRVAPNLGFAFGPALGSLCPLSSYPLLFAVSAAVTLLCAGLVAGALEDVPPVRGGASGASSFAAPFAAPVPSPRRVFLHYCFLTAGITVVMSQLIVGLSLHATRYLSLTHREVGLLYSLNGFLVAALQTRLTRLFPHARLSGFLAAGCLLYALGYGSVAVAGGFPGLLGAMIVITLGEMTLVPAMTALAANLAPSSRRGSYLGLYGMAHQTGSALGPLAGGWGLQFLSPRGPHLPWCLIAGLGAFSACGFYGLRSWLRPEQDRPPSEGG